jgi:hypothetical protein
MHHGNFAAIAQPDSDHDASKADYIRAIEHWTETRRVAEALTPLQRGPEKARLFEVWSADPIIRQQQIDLALGPRKPQKKRAQRKRVVKVLPPATCWEEEFARTIPGRPLCAPDAFELGVYPCKREIALGYPYVQFNRQTLFRWLVLDLDYAGAAHAWRAAGLPPPNLVMTNPANGHAHMAWFIAIPVRGPALGEAPTKSFRFLASIERAYRRRLNADEAFCMKGQVKNPLHSDWRTLRMFNTVRFENAAYSLRELAAPLKPTEMNPATKRKRPKREHEAGLGRNVTIFDELRDFSYGVALDFKYLDDFDGFLDQLFDHAEKLNDFRPPLPTSELRSIAKSVARWTWCNFSEKRFSQIQSWRGKRGLAKRWADHTTADERAAAAGVSRRTLYRGATQGRWAGHVTAHERAAEAGIGRATLYRRAANGKAQGETITGTIAISERVPVSRCG